MGEPGAHIGYAEHVDQELTQLVHPRSDLGDPVGQARDASAVLGQPGHGGVVVAHHGGARRRRGDDRVVTGEGVDEACHQRDALVPVAAVEVHLPAVGLRQRHLHLDALPLQHLNGRSADLREQRVVETGDEQPDLHP